MVETFLTDYYWSLSYRCHGTAAAVKMCVASGQREKRDQPTSGEHGGKPKRLMRQQCKLLHFPSRLNVGGFLLVTLMRVSH